MNTPLLSFAVALLAVAGCLALLVRSGRALLRLGLNAAEAQAVSGLAEVSERRGDLTGMMESRSMTTALRSARRRNMATVALYGLLLIGAPLAGLGREVYALAALLWFVPRRPVRPSATLRPDEREPRGG